MKAIVGLGNVGREYAGTRHNVGFEVIDEIARRWGVALRPWKSVADVAVASGRDAVLVKPLTFMNRSGEAVSRVAAFHKLQPSDVLVIVDEVQLPVGRLRLRRSGSAGGHNGLKSIEGALRSQEYARCRIGVGPSDPQRRTGDLADFVLGECGKGEAVDIRALLPTLEEALRVWTAEGIADVMNRFNR